MNHKLELRYMYLNATSLNKKKLKELELISTKLDIIFITETWFNEKSICKIDNYINYNRNRKKKRGGGVCIYAKEYLI